MPVIGMKVSDAINANTDATGVSASITTAAVPSTLTLGAANSGLTFTDARQDAGALFCVFSTKTRKLPLPITSAFSRCVFSRFAHFFHS
jgi:hypothetical protein